MGANEAAVHSLLPHIERFAAQHPKVAVEVRRVPSRQIAGAVLDRSIDFGVLTFQPADRGVQTILARRRRHRPAHRADASAWRSGAA